MTVRPTFSHPWPRRCVGIGTEKDALRIQLVTFEPGRQCDDAFARSSLGFEAVRLNFIDERRQVVGSTVTQPLGAAFSKGYSFEVSFVVPAPGTVLTSFVW